MSVNLNKIREHSDALYKIASESNPDGNMFRNQTEQDKRIGMAVWHAHEISKYLNAEIAKAKRTANDEFAS